METTIKGLYRVQSLVEYLGQGLGFRVLGVRD